jgi:hypothetical protein
MYFYILQEYLNKTGRWMKLADSTFTCPVLQHLLDQLPAFCWPPKLTILSVSTRMHFCKFCLSFNIILTLPASDTSVSVYLIHLTNAGRSASTIKEAVCAIIWAHRLTGLADPCKSDLVKIKNILLLLKYEDSW